MGATAELTIPEVGSSERNEAEERALVRGRELLHEEDGRICDALHVLGEELRDELRGEDPLGERFDYARDYSRKLVAHTEQCWATAILR
jgi:hypothetical protein